MKRIASPSLIGGVGVGLGDFPSPATASGSSFDDWMRLSFVCAPVVMYFLLSSAFVWA